MRTLFGALLVCALAAAACGSDYTIVDTSQLEVSANARVTAQTVLPTPEKYPALVSKLALAEELYADELHLLKQRRNKVRARRRYLNVLSFATLSATAAGVGVASVYGDGTHRGEQATGAAAIGGLVAGTVFQVAGLLQEDTDAVDQKIARLGVLHERMLDAIRDLVQRAAVADPQHPIDVQLELSRVIEDFIDEAQRINVKG